jgi:DNA-binding protein YbaB
MEKSKLVIECDGENVKAKIKGSPAVLSAAIATCMVSPDGENMFHVIVNATEVALHRKMEERKKRKKKK